MKAKQNLNFKIGETVVYPKHGVGEIVNIEPMEISSIKINFYVVKMEQAKLTILVPLDKQDEVCIIKISTKKIIDEIYEILKLKPKVRRIMWSRRAQEYDQKINSGKLYELAEVVRDLNKKTDIIAEQSYSERQLFEKAYNRLKSELEVVLGEKAQQKMDKALKFKENSLQKETLL